MFLSELYRYPVKSGQAQCLQGSPVGLLGLQGDRRWMIVEEENGRFLTQRAWPQLGQLKASASQTGELLLELPGQAPLPVAVPAADDALRGVTIWRDTLRVPDAGDEVAAWLSQWLGKSVRLVHCPEQRARYLPNGYGLNSDRAAFPDGFPLLLIGQGSLDDLNRRIGRPMEMLRFRPNLVVQGLSRLPRTAGSGSALASWSFECSNPVSGASSPPSTRRPGNAVLTVSR